MRVLVVGSGAREHAIAWKLAQSPDVAELYVAPGNAGTRQVAQSVPIAATDITGLLQFAKHENIELTVVGPEIPLALGIADRFQAEGMLVFGPTKAAARIETSKAFAKELMLDLGVPTGRAVIFDDHDEAHNYVRSSTAPIVVKADGLAAGKGVVVAETREEALDALRLQMVDKQFGAAGERVLIEEYLRGQELSVFAFADGERISSFVAACDYKRAGDGETGPITGGMGAYSPPEDAIWSEAVERQVRTEIMEPVVNALRERGSPYKGVLYAGLIITEDGPKVIEFNCRMGDPETQVVLPRLKSDLLEVIMGAARGDLSAVSLEWDPRPCVGVVVASGGYPGAYRTGYTVRGLGEIDEDVTVFHAGTRVAGSEDSEATGVVSDGGRVLTVAAVGETLEDARRKAYLNASRISFRDSFYRKDIAAIS